MERVSDPGSSKVLTQISPVLVAMLLGALSGHIASGDPEWAGLARRAAWTALAFLPMLAAHLAVVRWQRWPAAAVWLAGFVLYPALAMLMIRGSALSIWHWGLAAVLSLAFLLLHPSATQHRQRHRPSAAPFRHVPITLDGTVATLLALWAVGATSLFASTADAVRNQPLGVWVNWARIASEPLETVWYFGQFAAIALMLYGWYWVCRYRLVRQVLRRQGIVPFILATVAFVALGTPIVASIGLLMPLNIPEWTVIPSENYNPFDRDNFRFTFWVTAIAIPIILTVERLLAEQAEADTQHERVRAELHLLQQQINPHFLFNTLNTLYSLCLKDRIESAAAVVKLSDLLRYAVYSGQRERGSLDDEIAHLDNYLALQMLRFGHRCALHTAWPSDGSRFTVPPLLLIMLVENAFKHGVEPVEGPCEVRIAMTIVGERLHFECLNSLPDAAETRTPGLGLANLRRRLELLYDANYELTTGRSDGFWRARLAVDLQPC